MSLGKFNSDRKYLCSIALVTILFIVSGFVWGQNSVRIIDGGKTIRVSTFRKTPENILNQAGIVLNDKDEYRLSTAKVQDNTEIRVYRAVPVKFVYQGKEEVMITGKPTVGEFLAAQGLPENVGLVDLDSDTEIVPYMKIKAAAKHDQIVKRQEREPYQVIRRQDPTMELGAEEVVSEGVYGVKQVTVKIHYQDGKKVSEKVLEEKVITPSRPELIKVGTRNTVETSRGAVRFRKMMYMEATAYLPTDGNGDGITATGIPAKHGVIAVDPDVIPLGTRVYIPSYGFAVAADVGGAINGESVDVCVEDYDEAIAFGRRYVKVYLLN